MMKLNQGILIRIREESGKNQGILFYIQNGDIWYSESQCVASYDSYEATH